MSIHHKILELIYPAIKLKNFINQTNQLRVLLFHDIPQQNHEKFEKLLKFLKKEWEFISPEKFEDLYNNDDKTGKKKILLTFDDGYKSHRNIAEKFLNPLGIKAIFFVVSDFIKIESKNISKQFISSNIIPGSKLENLDLNQTNMTLEDLKYLIDSGHKIGAHTKSHKRLTILKKPEDLEEEIINSANELQKLIKTEINHFAYTFGDISSIDEKAINVIKKRFDFVHSGLRGNNHKCKKGSIICREAVDANQSVNLINTFLEGGADFYYKKSRKKLNNWIEK